MATEKTLVGLDKLSWAYRYMDVFNHLVDKHKAEMPFKGVKVAITLHLEAKTANLALAFKSLGADVHITGSNPLSTQDDIVEALRFHKVKVYAKHGCSQEEYDKFILDALAFKPNIIIDDGGDLVQALYEHPELAEDLWGGAEETTTGVNRLYKHELSPEGLIIPMCAVNDSKCKYLFDNRYGTGQSALEGIMRATNLTIAGSCVVVCGYGWCGKGLAAKAKGFGARVIVTEVDPIKALEAVFDGFDVMPISEAAKYGDFFITVTGDMNVISKGSIENLKDGAVLANAGHFDVEIDLEHLKAVSECVGEVRPGVTAYKLPSGAVVMVIADGRLVNLAAGDGHPVQIMDLSFAMQLLAALYILEHKGKLEKKVFILPGGDEEVAKIKLESMGKHIDELTSEQSKYLFG